MNRTESYEYMLDHLGILPLGDATIGVGLSLVAMVTIAMMSLSIRVGTSTGGGGAFDVLLVVLLTNIVVFVPGALFLHYPALGLSVDALWAFALAGLTGTLVARAFAYTSIERIGASRTEPIKSSQPLHATIIAVLVLNETVSLERVVGILLIVVGVGIVSWEVSRRSSDTTIDANRYELVIPLMAAFFYGIEPIFAKIGFGEGTPIAVGLAIKTIAALVGYLAFMVARGQVTNPLSLDASRRRWYVLAGFLNTTFLVLYYMALEIAPVSVVVPIITTSPVAVVVLSRLFLPDLERITWRIGTAATIVVVGGVLTTVFG